MATFAATHIRCCFRRHGKILHFTIRDLDTSLTNLILSSGPFFTLIWGWNNAPLQTAAVVKNRFSAGANLLIADPPYLLDFAPGDFLLFPKVKGQLAGLSFAQESLKKTW